VAVHCLGAGPAKQPFTEMRRSPFGYSGRTLGTAPPGQQEPLLSATGVTGVKRTTVTILCARWKCCRDAGSRRSCPRATDYPRRDSHRRVRYLGSVPNTEATRRPSQTFTLCQRQLRGFMAQQVQPASCSLSCFRFAGHSRVSFVQASASPWPTFRRESMGLVRELLAANACLVHQPTLGHCKHGHAFSIGA
jgi:hypothetical protein